MAITADNRMVMLTSVASNKDHTDLKAALMVGELALNTNTDMFYVGADTGGTRTKAAGDVTYNEDGAILGMKLSTAATAQALGTGASPTFVATTLSGGDINTGAVAHGSAGQAMTIDAGHALAGTTDNLAGGSLTISAGAGKGTGAGGDIIFKTADAGSSGSIVNPLATALTISDDLSATFAGDIDCGGDIEFNGLSGTGAVTVTNILDEDAMGTNSDTALATQQSIKAYADTMVPLAGGTMGGHLVVPTGYDVQIADAPGSSTDAANKAYVDAQHAIAAQGLAVKADCKVATTGELDATYANVDTSPDGVGATLTNAGNAAVLVIDGVTMEVGDRVLVKDQATGASAYENGIYEVTTVGDASSSMWLLTRVTDMDTGGTGATARATWSNAFVFITHGTNLGATSWVSIVDEVDFSVGVTLCTFAQFNASGNITGGTGLTKTGNDLAVDASQTQITAVGTLSSLAVGGNVTMYEDTNNADVKLSMGTASAESFNVEVLNGTSNKTAEEIKISTATASGTANHGKISIYIDGAEIMDIDDGGIDMASGKSVAIDGTDLTSNSDTTYTAGDGLSLTGNDFDVEAAQTLITSIYNTSLLVGSAANQEYITFGTANEVNTFVNNTERLSVTNTGVDVTGALTATSFAPTSLAVGGGFGDTGATISATGAISADGIMVVNPDAATPAAGASWAGVTINPDGVTEESSGTHAYLASLFVDEPVISHTAGGTITRAATVYINDAPTEGASNYALWCNGAVGGATISGGTF